MSMTYLEAMALILGSNVFQAIATFILNRRKNKIGNEQTINEMAMTQIKQLSGRLDKVQKTSDDLWNKYSELKSENIELRAENIELKAENIELKDRVAQLEKVTIIKPIDSGKGLSGQ